MSNLNRREFIAASTVSFVATFATGNLLAQAAAPGAKPWYATMRRCGQINFNEEDPLTMDATAWIDYFASLKVDAVLLNGGGIMAYYPTEVPYQHKSELLGTRDLFGELVTAARKRNLRVVARMDCNYSYQEAFQAHAEWFELNANGSTQSSNMTTYISETNGGSYIYPLDYSSNGGLNGDDHGSVIRLGPDPQSTTNMSIGGVGSGTSNR